MLKHVYVFDTTFNIVSALTARVWFVKDLICKGLAHFILLFKFIEASMNVIVMCLLVHKVPQNIKSKTSKYVAVHGLVQLNKVVRVAKTIKRHLRDRCKGFAHFIILFKFIEASMNAIGMCLLVHEVHKILNQVLICT